MYNDKKTLFIDFDGTIVDVSRRHYKVYEETVKQLSANPVSQQKYWRMRRNGDSFFDIVKENHNIVGSKSLKHRYFSLIERKQYLGLDSKYKGVDKILKQLRKYCRIVLVSLRLSSLNLKWQLNKLNLVKSFDEVLAAHIYKYKLIKQSSFFKGRKRYLVGDTEADINSGKRCGCVTIGVYSGLRSKRYLSKFCPEYLIKDISGLAEIIKQ